LLIVGLMWMISSGTAQAQACDEAANEALILLEGARSLLEDGNTQGAAALILSAEDILKGCQPGAVQATVEAPSETQTDLSTPVPTTAAPVAVSTDPTGGYSLNPVPIDPAQGIAFVNFIHTSVDAGAIDIYYGNDEILVVAGLTYGTFTGLMPIQAGNRTFRARPAGSGPSGEVLYRLSWDYLANSTWMVTAAGIKSVFAFIVEPITIIRNAYEGNARVRVINLIATGPRVTVTDSSGKVFGDGLGWVGIKDSLVAPGEYVLSASTQTGLEMPQPLTTTFEANHTYTLLMIGNGTPEQPLAILMLPIPQDITRVKFINGRSDIVDVHARPGNEKIVTLLEPGAETDWIELPSGAFTFIAYAPDTGPTGRELAGIATQLRPQRDVTITIGESAMQTLSTELRPQ
jgi:hypothetical protein